MHSALHPSNDYLYLEEDFFQFFYFYHVYIYNFQFQNRTIYSVDELKFDILE